MEQFTHNIWLNNSLIWIGIRILIWHVTIVSKLINKTNCCAFSSKFNEFMHSIMCVTGGGGGHSTFMWTGGGGVPLGVENLTLSQTARCTKNTPCHNIPYCRTSKKITTMHKLYSMFMLEAWRWQNNCKTLAHYTSGNAKRAKRKFIRNASTSEEFGKIRRCFYWRHERHQSNGSRRLS